MTINFKPPESLFTPLLENQNAVLTFETNNIVIDPDTGQAKIGKGAEISLEAIAHSDSDRNEDEYFAGKDQKIQLVRGRLVNPKTFPPEITHLQEGYATIDGKTGKFILELYSQNPYVGDILGTKFNGKFILD